MSELRGLLNNLYVHVVLKLGALVILNVYCLMCPKQKGNTVR